MDNGKIERVLGIYTRLMDGALINKSKEAVNYGVNERTIQRDIDDIRNYMDNDVENTGIINSVVYSKSEKGYRLEQVYRLKLTNGEILAICKILLDSRAFRKEDMTMHLISLFPAAFPKVIKSSLMSLSVTKNFIMWNHVTKNNFLMTCGI